MMAALGALLASIGLALYFGRTRRQA
jgi:hypothetical protein